MKSVLISIQPYWVFLMIVHLMGWDIPQEKTIEVRKDFPKAAEWNRITLIYCSKNKKSFNRIPKQYQPFMENLLGKVIGEFVCDRIEEIKCDNGIQAYYSNREETCLSDFELRLYATVGKPLYFWHISDLKIYNTPKKLSEFRTPCPPEFNSSFDCSKKYTHCKYFTEEENGLFGCAKEGLTRPPQSWCYVEEL